MFLNTYIPNPVAFSLFGLDIMWYGVLIGAGMLIGATLMYKRAPRYGIRQDRIIDILIISIPLGIVGARLYYVAFNWNVYAFDFLKIINVREGGLAIHGGLILGFLAAGIVCDRQRVGKLNFFDLAVPSIALAQAIGRWGNYFNAEAHGGPTNLPWAIPVGEQMVHPTFLYESIWCFLLFLLLIFIGNRRKFEGQAVFLYGMLYSLERFFVEFLRTDSLMAGTLKQAQVISVAIFVICLIAYLILNREHRKRHRRYIRV